MQICYNINMKKNDFENVLLTISYNGKNYHGWQRQNGKITVQQVIEDALSTLYGSAVVVTGSGRTDAGVSAIGQTANFFAPNKAVLVPSLKGRLNSVLPRDIRIVSAKRVAQDFNARKSAKLKTYFYSFYQSSVEIPYLKGVATGYKQKIDFNVFEKSAQMFVGTHDFASFCASGSSVESTVRTIKSCKLSFNGIYYTLAIEGNGFLYKMVRNIVGTLIDVSSGKITLSVPEIINAKNRTFAGATAPAEGLVLANVQYD